MNTPVWFGVVVRANTPAPIVAKLRTEFNTVIASEGYAQALEKQFMEVMQVPPETSEQFLAAERKLWSDAVRATGVSMD
jgi:tripartite-type tricarboxylate transporter receptor subunit TctC